MSNEIIKVLDDLSQRFGIVIDWTDKNVFPYLLDLTNRIVKYEIINSIIWIAFELIVWLVIIIVCNKMIEEKENKILIFCMVSAIALVMIGLKIFNIVTCICIPEQIILEFINENINLLQL